MNAIKKEGAFQLFEKRGDLMLTSEKLLFRILQGPDAPLFLKGERGVYFTDHRCRTDGEETTLRDICLAMKKDGCTEMEVSYDFFYEGCSERRYYPSDEVTVRAFKVIHDTLAECGLGFGASLLSPLDVGGGWAKQSRETGFTCQYLEAPIAPDGSYCADMVCQRQWCNNKGPVRLIPERVLAYAFDEEFIEGTSFSYVDENGILDISSTAAYAIEEEKETVTGAGYGSCPMRIYGKWENPTRSRVLCVMVYRTPELDYFSPDALPFMKHTLDLYNEAGVRCTSFYSDEMHIQFDWDLNAHFGETEIRTRYLTQNLADAFAEKYGEKYRDFARYLIYMSYDKREPLPGEKESRYVQHVFGRSPEAVAETWLFRNRYFELLQRRVVDLCNDARAYAESLWGAPLMTRAHATWQESPTCDRVCRQGSGGWEGDASGKGGNGCTAEQRAQELLNNAKRMYEQGISRYDYTPWYDWSASIRENMSACYDYFKWNEFLSGGGNDHAEGGYLDRNYFGIALACSFGELNRFGVGYCCAWGMPDRVYELLAGVNLSSGNTMSIGGRGTVNCFGARSTDVLALYPIKLNNAEERFGSWMVQYGYCNYITEEKLLERAEVTSHGTLRIGRQEYRCLVAMYEPFLSKKTFALLEKFLAAGGRVLWMSAPALLDEDGEDASARFASLFGLASVSPAAYGEACAGETVQFTGCLQEVTGMKIPTGLAVDRVFFCRPDAHAEAAAQIAGKTAAVCRHYPNGGLALYAGFRLRDDQSCSLGEDVDTLFRVLCAIGAYRPGSLEVRSRRTDAVNLLCTFPDGSVAAAPHFRRVWEGWNGPYYRDDALDELVLADRADIPDGSLLLDEEILGHAIRYTGSGRLSYRLDEAGVPEAFYGENSTGLTVDGVTYTYADRPASFEFSPVEETCLTGAAAHVVTVCCTTPGAVLSVPVRAESAPEVLACRDYVFCAEDPVPHTWADGRVSLSVTPELAGRWLLIVY